MNQAQKKTKELFDMVYQWGRVGLVTDETSPAFVEKLNALLNCKSEAKTGCIFFHQARVEGCHDCPETPKQDQAKKCMYGREGCDIHNPQPPQACEHERLVESKTYLKQTFCHDCLKTIRSSYGSKPFEYHPTPPLELPKELDLPHFDIWDDVERYAIQNTINQIIRYLKSQKGESK